jgi:hypothetical protein
MTTPLPLSLDHFQLNKFQGPDDVNYQSVRNALQKMVDYAAQCVSTLFDAPYPRNPKFHGRKSIFELLHKSLDGRVGAARAALYGLGGSGYAKLVADSNGCRSSDPETGKPRLLSNGPINTGTLILSYGHLGIR